MPDQKFNTLYKYVLSIKYINYLFAINVNIYLLPSWKSTYVISQKENKQK